MVTEQIVAAQDNACVSSAFSYNAFISVVSDLVSTVLYTVYGPSTVHVTKYSHKSQHNILTTLSEYGFSETV